MPYPNIIYLSYKEILTPENIQGFYESEIPIEHQVSLPLPTKQWLKPAYACFASPALRKPHQPKQQGVPDRWWVIDARSGHLLIYTLWEVFAFANGVQWVSVILPRQTRSIAEQQEELATIELLIDKLAPAFFDDQQGDTTTRKALMEALNTHIPVLLHPQYRSLVSDFFAWLEA